VGLNYILKLCAQLFFTAMSNEIKCIKLFSEFNNDRDDILPLYSKNLEIKLLETKERTNNDRLLIKLC